MPIAPLTHRQVEQRVTIFWEEQGLRRIRNGRFNVSLLKPDLLFEPKNQAKGVKSLIMCEVKPENATIGEIKKGIGQCALYLPYENIYPYLTVSNKWLSHLSELSDYLPWLGILLYDFVKVWVIQHSKRDKTRQYIDEQSTSPIDKREPRILLVEKYPQQLACDLALFELLKEFYPNGEYYLWDIAERWHEKYPNMKQDNVKLAKRLMRFGAKRLADPRGAKYRIDVTSSSKLVVFSKGGNSATF